MLERTTAIQTKSDGVSSPTVIKHDGWIVAFTVGLSRLSSNAKTVHSLLHGLDTAYGGVPQLALSVLKRGPKNTYTVAAQSGNYHLIPFLGRVLTERLSFFPKFSAFTALPVKKGEVLALTVPTWAPILTYNLSAGQFAYAQSRTQNCDSAAGSQTAQMKVGASTRYGCAYTGTRFPVLGNRGHERPVPQALPALTRALATIRADEPARLRARRGARPAQVLATSGLGRRSDRRRADRRRCLRG